MKILSALVLQIGLRRLEYITEIHGREIIKISRETLLGGRCANKTPGEYKNVGTGKHAAHVEMDESKAGLVRKIFQGGGYMQEVGKTYPPKPPVLPCCTTSSNRI